jgi:glutamine cyclotransferase
MMMRLKNKILILLLLLAGCSGPSSREVEGVQVIPECKVSPGYLARAGFLPGKPFGLSVSERGVTGLSMVQFPAKGVPYKLYRHPSWDIAGHLGAVATDAKGNSYVIPRPFINTLRNDPALQNIIYRIDAQTGEMKEWIKLPSQRPLNGNNPFGLMGLAYDCESGLLYAASVAGSDARHESGSIYAISTEEQAVVKASFHDIDAMGVGLAYLDGKKYLFTGMARNGRVYKIRLDKNGGFASAPEQVVDLALLGDRGGDKVRKIRFDAQGNMYVAGITFHFNLANSPDKRDNIYVFRYQPGEGTWALARMEKGIL